MIEVEMSKDIRAFEPKLVGPLTKRQIIVIAIGLGYGVPAYFLFKTVINDVVVRLILTIFLMIPTFLCGWISLYGIPLEKFAILMLKNTFIKPKIRKAESPNSYQEIEELFVDGQEKKKEKVGFFDTIKYSKTDKPIR